MSSACRFLLWAVLGILALNGCGGGGGESGGFFPSSPDYTPSCSGASPAWTSTPDYESVASCVSQASPGDTINITAGEANWRAKTLSVNKAIRIIGNGPDTTTISGNGTVPLFDVSTGSSTGAFPFRLSGLKLSAPQGRLFQISGAGSGWRIDHNVFQGTDYADITSVATLSNVGTWTLFGLIDQNVFNYCQIGFAGGGTAAHHSWTSAPQWGTANAIFLENNTFLMADVAGVFHNSVDSNNGARAVIRYNTFNDAYIMAHSACQKSVRATRSYEIYNNRFNRSVSNTFTSYLSLRGGSHVITGNVVSGPWAQWLPERGAVVLDNRRSWFDNGCTQNSQCTGAGAPAVCCTGPGIGNCIGSQDGFGDCNGSSVYDTNVNNAAHGNAVDGYRCLDQTGAGTMTGTLGSGHSQEVDPLYAWNNQSGRNCLGGSNKYDTCTSDSQCLGSTCSTDTMYPNRFYLHNNSDNMACTAAGVPYSCCTGSYAGACPTGTNWQQFHVVDGRDFISDTPRPGYTKYTCPHPLAGSGSCNPDMAGRTGYTLD